MVSSTNWFIKNSNIVIQWTTICLALIYLFILITYSILIKDLIYPRAHPYLFILETLLFSFGCASILFLMAYGRNTITINTIYINIYKIWFITYFISILWILYIFNKYVSKFMKGIFWLKVILYFFSFILILQHITLV